MQRKQGQMVTTESTQVQMMTTWQKTSLGDDDMDADEGKWIQRQIVLTRSRARKQLPAALLILSEQQERSLEEELLLEMKNKGKKRVSKMWQSSVLDLFKEKKYYGQSSVLFVPHFFVFCERKTQRQIKEF